MRGIIKGVAGAAVVAALGYGAYRLYKRYKDRNKVEQEIITVDEAVKIRESKLKPLPSEVLESIRKAEAEESNVIDFAKSKLRDIPMRPKEMLSYDGDEDDGSEFEIEEDGGEETVKKGTDPNSIDALEQYIRMQTAEFDNGSNNEIIIRTLHRHEFRPATIADETLYGALLDRRREFFGPDSKWAKGVSWADVILNYAEKLEYHLEESLEHWTTYILDQIGLKQRMSKDEIDMYLADLENHTFYNHTTGYFGMFGLDDGGMIELDDMLQYAVEKRYSFEMEFNSFLGMVLEDDEDDNEGV